MIVVLGLAALAVVAVWKVANFGDSLAGWLAVKDRLSSWRQRQARRGASPYLWAVGFVAVGWLLVKVPAARGVAGEGGLAVGSIAWALFGVAARWWPFLLTVGAALALVHQRQRSKRRLRGEPPDRRGKARAALLELVHDAVADTLPHLYAKADGRAPQAGAPSFFATTVAGRTREWGVRVRVHMRHGGTIGQLRKYSSDGTDPEHDRLATSIEASLRDDFAARTTAARQVLAASPRRPVFPYSAVVPIRTKDGSVNPGYADLLVLRDNPLRSAYRYPAQRPKVRHLGDPVLVGITMDAREAKATIRESHTSIWGQNRMGKTFYALNLAIGASQCPHTAFVVLDFKGPGGDLTALAPRAAAVVTDVEKGSVALQWLYAEKERRSLATTTPGKLTRFSAELPEIVVFMDEWHRITDDPAALAAIEGLVREAATFGIYLVAVDQILHARQVPTSLTGQFHNKVSVRLGSQAHTGMIFEKGDFPEGGGPHRIPPSWKGVAYGRFGENAEVVQIKSLLSGPEVAARWAKRDAEAGLRVELSGLEGALAGAAAEPEQAAPPPSPVSSSVESVEEPEELALQSLPRPVADAVAYFSAALDQPPPERLSARELRDLGTKGRTKVTRSKGATDERCGQADEHREAIRAFLNPHT